MVRDVDILRSDFDPLTGSSPHRIRSGIPGFDELVGGGLIKDRIYLLAGPAGAGKTIFSNQFLYHGITKYGENGVYVVVEEPPYQIRENMLTFGWDLSRVEDSGQLIILDAATARLGFNSREKFVVPRPFTLEGMLYEIQTCIQKIGAKRVVIDSLDAMESPEGGDDVFRRILQKLTMILKSFGCTTLMLTETVTDRMAGRRGVEEFVADGTVMLHHVLEEAVTSETTLEANALQGNALEQESFALRIRSRKIEIRKIRGSAHSNYIHPFVIGSNGLEVLTKPDVSKRMRRAVFKANPLD